MEELQNRDDMEDEKTFVRNFFKKRMIWINKDHYCFLTHKKYRIAILILKKLLELEKCSQKKIVSEIKKDLEIYVKDVLKKGADKAREQADSFMIKVRNAVGIVRSN